MSIATQDLRHHLTSEEISAVRLPLDQAHLLPAKVYSDKAIFDLEREQIFRKTWMPVCHVSMLQTPGTFVTRTLGGEAIVALCDRAGEIKVMSNVCRHRNSTLLSGSGQTKGNRIVCPYHGWTYGLDGKLLAAPFMDEITGFVRRDIQLPVLRHEIWQGFVFVTLSDSIAPLAESLEDLTKEIEPYRMAEKEAFPLHRLEAPWNWKISLENFSEAYHQPWVHPITADHAFPAQSAVYMEATGPYSIFQIFQAPETEFPNFEEPVEGFPDRLMRAASVFNVYPYFHALSDSSVQLILDFNIIDERRHELVWTLLMPKGSRTRPEIDKKIASYLEFITPIFNEDVAICRGVAAGIDSVKSGQGRLSKMERALHQFHNWWLDHMLSTSSSATRT